MKRYDTVYFLHELYTGRTVVRKGVVVSVNPDTVIITPAGSKRVVIIPKEQVSASKDKLQPAI